MFVRPEKSSLYHLKADCPLLVKVKPVELTLAECLEDVLYSEKVYGRRIFHRRELCRLCGGAK